MKHLRTALAVTIIASSFLSACGGGSSSTPVLPITPAPVATVIPENLSIQAAATVDVGNPTSFEHSAAALSGLKYAWTFGDGSTSTEVSPKHDYAKVGDYEVLLKVSNEVGATKEVKFRVSVNNRSHVRGLACTAEADSGWCWQHPKPSGNYRADIFFLDAKTAWSVGDNGEILKSSNGGITWRKQSSGLRTSLSAIRFADANFGWAVGAFGSILRTVDGGVHWTLQSSWLSPDAAYQYGDPKLTVIDANTAVIANGDVIRSTRDGGNTWTQQNFNTSQVGTDGVLWSNYSGKLSKSVDFGKTSTVMTTATGNYNNLNLIGKTTVLLSATEYSYEAPLGYSYKLMFKRSLDSGSTWETIQAKGLPSINLYVTKMEFSDVSNGLIIVNGNEAYRTFDGGRNWTPVQHGLANNQYLQTVQIFPGNVIVRWVSGSQANVLDMAMSEDGGQNWRSITSPPNPNPNINLIRIDAKTWFRGLGTGISHISSDGMQTWQLSGGADEASQTAVRATWFFDAKHGLALSAAGELKETNNGGLDWTVKVKDVATPSYRDAKLQFISTTKGWLLPGDGKLYRSIDGGASWWAPLTNFTDIGIFDFVDENNGFAISRDKNPGESLNKPILIKSVDGGQAWTKVANFVEGIRSIRFISPNRGLAVASNGRIFGTEDGVLNWVLRFSGAGGDLNRVIFSDPTTAWIVGNNGVFLQSIDAGLTWSSVVQVNASNLRDIQFLDAQRAWVVGDAGTILRTQDAGKTWQRIYSGTQKTLNQVFFVDSRTGWVMGEDGSILATGTGGI
jgi:photosystem II stability/assembly factor-like uncharacterized protein